MTLLAMKTENTFLTLWSGLILNECYGYDIEIKLLSSTFPAEKYGQTQLFLALSG